MTTQTTPDAMTAHGWTTYEDSYFVVGVFWTKDQEYGCGNTRHKTREDAHKEVEHLERLGYGNPDKGGNASQIHVVHVSTKQVRII
jgi:hypothetical protein